MRGSILCGRCRKPIAGDPERRCRCVGPRRSFALVIELPRHPDTGKRRQRWRSYKVPRDVNRTEAMKRATAELAKLLHQANTGALVDLTRATVIEYLRDWYEKVVVPSGCAEATLRSYKAMIEVHVAPSSLATKPLQRVRRSDLEAFYATAERRSLGHQKKPARKLAPKSINVLHSILRQAFERAIEDDLLVSNPAAKVKRPREPRDQTKDAREHCWSADEARAVLVAAEAVGPQASAFFALALNVGARRNELLGLQWKDVDLDAGTVTIAKQLARGRSDAAPTFRPTKTERKAPTVSIDDETTTRLRAHRKAQRELMMRNRSAYRDYGLVFAKEPSDLQTPTAALGQPCPALISRTFRQVLKAAGVRRIKVHGMRHTCATLLLGAGVAVHVVSQRLGHKNATQTLNVYADALPTQQRDAADRLGALLARTSKADQAANG